MGGEVTQEHHMHSNSDLRMNVRLYNGLFLYKLWA